MIWDGWPNRDSLGWVGKGIDMVLDRFVSD